MRRRGFLVRGGALIAAASLPTPWLWGQGQALAAEPADLPPAAWRTLSAVQAHLLPSEAQAPGATEVKALEYLLGMLGRPQVDEAAPQSIIQGTAEIERLAQARFGQPFADLGEAQREAVLRTYEATEPGRRWLAGQLAILIEALLGDPVYGGNPDQIGWRWLDHNPGFPLPPADKRYHLLPEPGAVRERQALLVPPVWAARDPA